MTLRVFTAAALKISQASGAPGAKITVSASGFGPGETVEIFAGQLGGAPLLTVAADTNGSFTVPLREAQSPFGSTELYAEGISSGRLGAAKFFVIPVVKMRPDSLPPGADTDVFGFGFGANEAVDYYWDEPRKLLGTVQANGKGSGVLAIAIPLNAAPGLHAVLGVGQVTQGVGVGEMRVQ